jgi:hypothetical protein
VYVLELMDKVINEGEQILILPGDSIQHPVVLDKPYFFLMKKTGAPRGDLDCLMCPVANASSEKASISACSVRVIG